MSEISNSCYLLYGVKKFPSDYSLDTSLEYIKYNELALYYHKVSLNEFSEENLKKNLNNLEWLEKHVIEYEKEMEKLNSETTVIPFKFGTVYTSIENMEDFFSSYYDTFVESISYLQDKLEWGIKIFLSRSQFRRWLDSKIQDDSSGKATGAAFFKRKKKEIEMMEQEDVSLNSIVSEICSEIKKNVIELKEVDFLEGPGNNKSLFKPIYGLGVIMEIFKTTILSSLIDKLTNRHKEKGIILRLSGPWPPYNFVKIES